MASARKITCILSVTLASLLALLIGRLRTRNGAPAVAPRPFLNESELDFYRRLRHALPEYQILPQVSLAALMHPAGAGLSRKVAQHRIDRGRIDYVVANRTDLSVRALVELDDRASEGGRDADVHRLTASAGYTTHRFSYALSPSPLAIREQLLGPPTAEIIPLSRPASPDR